MGDQGPKDFAGVVTSERVRRSLAELEHNAHRVTAASIEARQLGARSVEVGYARESGDWREAGWWFTAVLPDGSDVSEVEHRTPWAAAEAVVERLRAR